MKSDLFLESVAKNYITETGDDNASMDWISIAMEIGAVLIPRIKGCIEQRQGTPKSMAAMLKNRPIIARSTLLSQLRMSKIDQPRAAVRTIMNNIDAMEQDELAEAIQDAYVTA